MSTDSALAAEEYRVFAEDEAMTLNPERDLQAGLVSAMRAAGAKESASRRKRFTDSDTPMQRHLLQRFLDAQGTSMKDARAREIRAENARRFAKWLESSSLDSRGNRSI